MPEASCSVDHREPPPACGHLAAIHPVTPYTVSCQKCLDRGQDWAELWLCLSCGWVACSNDSPNQHAKAHYEETDHPIAAALQHGIRPLWCHVDQLFIRP
jgi:uncharacterized UBP type Zn finger protein